MVGAFVEVDVQDPDATVVERAPEPTLAARGLIPGALAASLAAAALAACGGGEGALPSAFAEPAQAQTRRDILQATDGPAAAATAVRMPTVTE